MDGQLTSSLSSATNKSVNQCPRSTPRMRSDLIYLRSTFSSYLGNQVDKARHVYERYVTCLPTIKAWQKYAKFEAKHGEKQKARDIYERAVEIFSGENASIPGIGDIKVGLAEEKKVSDDEGDEELSTSMCECGCACLFCNAGVVR